MGQHACGCSPFGFFVHPRLFSHGDRSHPWVLKQDIEPSRVPSCSKHDQQTKDTVEQVWVQGCLLLQESQEVERAHYRSDHREEDLQKSWLLQYSGGGPRGLPRGGQKVTW